MKTRLAGFLCPPESAHNRYYRQSIRQAFSGEAFKPSAKLLADMDEEQRRYDEGRDEWGIGG